MVFTRSLISESSSPNHLMTVDWPSTIGITVTFMFHCFFNSLARSRYLSFFSLTFNFTLWSAGTVLYLASWRFLVDYYLVWSSSRDEVIRLYLKIPEEFVCVILQVVHIPFIHVVKLQCLPRFPVDHLVQPCLVLYSLCANLLHSLIMWLIVLSLSPHNLHLLFCCVLSLLDLIWLVLMALFCAAWPSG